MIKRTGFVLSLHVDRDELAVLEHGQLNRSAVHGKLLHFALAQIADACAVHRLCEHELCRCIPPRAFRRTDAR